MRTLVRRFPALDALPYVPLADLPTPVEAARPLAEASGFAEVWIKRDDLTAQRYGGNKVRKLAFLLGQARARGARRLWTVGALGSNHALATAVHGTAQGFVVTVRHFPQPVTRHVRLNCLAVAATGARLSVGPRWSAMAHAVRARLESRWPGPGGTVYAIPAGGSTAVGALGYVDAALELDAQMTAGELPPVDVVVVAAGTCGTLAGLLVGFELAQRPVEVVGVRVVQRHLANRLMVRRLCEKVRRLLADHGVTASGPARPTLRLDHTQYGLGYGRPTAVAVAAMRLGAELGLVLELTYTAKALAALLTRGEGGRRALFWHTLNSRPMTALVPPELRVEHLPPSYRSLLGPTDPAGDLAP